MKERLPPLRWRAYSSGHLLGHARLSDIHTELEQALHGSAARPTADWQYSSRGSAGESPAAEWACHHGVATSNQYDLKPARCQRTIVSGLTIANASQTLGNNRWRLTNIHLDGTEGEFLWSSPPQNVYLLPQCPNLCLKRCPRPEQIDENPSNEPAKVPQHKTASLDSRLTANRIWFATGTARAINHNICNHRDVASGVVVFRKSEAATATKAATLFRLPIRHGGHLFDNRASRIYLGFSDGRLPTGREVRYAPRPRVILPQRRLAEYSRRFKPESSGKCRTKIFVRKTS